MTTTEINLDLIDEPTPLNGRLERDPERVKRLALQIAQQGLLNPITVHPTGDRYQLIAGAHRLAALRTLGRTTIPATIITNPTCSLATLRLAENVNRTNLSPVEEAHQLLQLVNDNPQGVDGVAADLNRPATWILDRLEIANWPESLQQHLHAKRVSLAAAKLLARISPPELRDLRIQDAATHGCSARTASLWLQATYRDNLTDADLPKFSAQIPAVQYNTITTVLCFSCRQYHPIDATTSVRLCTTCFHTISEAIGHHAEQPPTHQPPIYDPPSPRPRELDDPNLAAQGHASFPP